MAKVKRYKIIITSIILVVILLTVKLFSLVTGTGNLRKIYINNQIFWVDIADTDQKRTIGLSGRKILPQNHGMLFIMNHTSLHKFWMKDMNFPLDFVWINNDKIVDLSENIPNPSIGSLNISIVSPKYPSDKVLELNSGTIRSYNIKMGDLVKY